MKSKKSNKKNIVVSAIFIAAFMFLMIYALRQDPSYTPSQLVGKHAPVFTAKSTSGETIYSDNIFESRRWVVVNFWSSFCIVCRAEAPELESFYQTVTLANKKNPLFLSINIQDDEKSIIDWQKNYGQTFSVIQDSKGLISVKFGVTGTPETFFVDPNGVVRFRIAGEVNTEIILSFIAWLEKNPQATQEESTKALIQIRSTKT